MQKKRLNVSSDKKFNMMKDFDILTITSNQQKALYDQANFEKGIEMMKPTFVRNQQGQKFSLFVPIQQFKRFGPGMYLLFLFLKYATILFFIISIFSFINLGILLKGDSLNTKQSGFQITIAETTLGNAKQGQITVIIVIDYLITVIIFIAIILWKQYEPTYVVQCCEQIMLPSYQTVVLKRIPELYTEQDMKTFLEDRFGQVQDIYTVRNFHNDLYHYKQITKIINEYKQQRALIKIKPDRGSIALTKMFFDYEQYYYSMLKKNAMSKYPKEFAFITFKSVKSRQEMLKFYERIFPELSQDRQEEYLYKGQQLKIKACMMQPNGIKWENLNLSKPIKFMWIAVQILLLIIVLGVSILVIFLFYIAESSLSLSQYHGLPKSQILNFQSTEAMQSYCLGLPIYKFNSDSDCQQFTSQYVKYSIFFIALPLTIAIFKFLLTEIMKALVSVRRHPYEIAKIQSQIIIMFVFYFFATGILQYISFLEINFEDGSTFSFANIIHPVYRVFFGYLNDHSQNMRMAIDYNQTWYMMASYKIILISMVSFNLSSVGKIFYSFIRKFACQFYARKQELQCRMNYWLEGEQMEIQFIYAVAATIICFALLFGASIPLVYPFTCIALMLLFWSTKFIFINFCAKPLLYSHSMNSLIVKILFFGVIIHSFTAPLFFGASQIYSKEGIRNFLRIPYFGYYIALMVIPLIYMLYRVRLSNLFDKIRHFYTESFHKDEDFQTKRVKKMSLPSKLCLIEAHKFNNQNDKVMLYSMHQNHEYQMILKTLYTINKEQRARATCVLNKQLYNLLQKDGIMQLDEQKKYQTILFNELLRLTKTNYAKFENRVGKKYSRSNNPYLLYLKQLRELQKDAKLFELDQDVRDEFQMMNFKSNSLKKFAQRNFQYKKYDQKMTNFQRIKKIKENMQLQEIVQRSQSQQKSRYMNSFQQRYQQGPQSQVRLVDQRNYLSPRESISYLQTISRFNPKYSRQLRPFEDRIIETQLMINSKILSDKKIHQPPEKDVPLNLKQDLKEENNVINIDEETINSRQRESQKLNKKSKKQKIIQCYRRNKKILTRNIRFESQKNEETISHNSKIQKQNLNQRSQK